MKKCEGRGDPEAKDKLRGPVAFLGKERGRSDKETMAAHHFPKEEVTHKVKCRRQKSETKKCPWLWPGLR